MDNFTQENITQETVIIPDEVKVKEGRYNYTIVALGMFVFGIVSIFFQYVLSYILRAVAVSHPQIRYATWLDYIFVLIPMYVFAFPICSLVFKVAPKAPERSEKIKKSTLIAYFVMMIPLTLLLNLFSIKLADVLSDGTATNPINEMITEVNFWQVATVVILAPIVEELIFRKFLIDRTRQFGEKLAIFFSAFCFGLFHMNIFQMLYAFAMGLLLAYIYTRSGRIKYTICIHMFFNFCGSVVPLTVLKLVPDVALEALGTNEYVNVVANLTPSQTLGLMIYLLYILLEVGLFIAGIIILIVFLVKKKFYTQPATMELPKNKRFSTAFLTIGFLFFLAYCLYGTIVNFIA